MRKCREAWKMQRSLENAGKNGKYRENWKYKNNMRINMKKGQWIC